MAVDTMPTGCTQEQAAWEEWRIKKGFSEVALKWGMKYAQEFWVGLKSMKITTM